MNVQYKRNAFASIFKHSLFRGSSIYLTIVAINLVLSFFLVPVFTRYLTPYDYGIMSTVQVSLSIASIIVGVGVEGTIPVNFFKLNIEVFNIYLRNIFFLILINFLVVFVVVWVLDSTFLSLIPIPENWLYIAIPTVFSAAIVSFATNLLIAKEKVVIRSIYVLCQSLMPAGLSILFIVGMSMNWKGRLLALFISSYVFGGIGLLILSYQWRHSRINIKLDYLKDALKFGVPLIPFAISGQVMMGIDRFFINSMISVSQTGIYSVGYQMGMLVSVFGSAFNSIWTPYFYRKLSENTQESKRNIVKLSYLLFVIFISMALTWGFVSPFLLRYLLGERFQTSISVVFWIALGYAFESIYLILSGYILFSKRTYLLTVIGIVSALVNVAFNYILIQHNGIIGAAQATCITYLVFAVLTGLLVQKMYKMPWSLKLNNA